MADTPLGDQIETIAQGPAEATGDSGSVKEHPLPDLIAADKHLAGRGVAADPWGCAKLRKFVPPGTVR